MTDVLVEVNTVGKLIYSLPPYLLFTLIGAVIASCIFIVLLAVAEYPVTMCCRILAVSLVGLVVGSRLFGILSGIYRTVGLHLPLSRSTIAETGVVFYGGLLGFVLTYTLLLKKNSLDMKILDVVAIVIPLFHSVARIGCFFAGCCFGCEYKGHLSVLYTNYVLGEVITAQRFPIQLVESAFNFSLFGYLLIQMIRSKTGLLRQYFFLYSLARLLLECFRGDEIRGLISGISFSQVISLLIIIVITILSITRKEIFAYGHN